MEGNAPQPDRPDEHVARTQVQHPSCPYCHADVRPTELQPFGCSSCMAWSHFACWEEHGACAACGASAGPRPSASGRSERPAPTLGEATDAGGRRANEPWWVGRTNACSGCGARFVVTNRYQRFKCPSCAPVVQTWHLLAGLVLLVLFPFVFQWLAEFLG